ncbi:hypothetical protein LXL04_029670 [Taraxacum kok-saghyz]
MLDFFFKNWSADFIFKKWTLSDFFLKIIEVDVKTKFNNSDFIEIVWYMMFDTQVVVHPLETEIPEADDPNDHIECDKDEVNDESIVGKVFDTPDDAYNYYNDYSFLHGFGIRKDDTIKNPTTNEAYRKMYVCNKEGFKRLEKNDSIGNEKKQRRDVRTGCQAMLRIRRQEDGKWMVDSFKDTHNHDKIMTPTKVMQG